MEKRKSQDKRKKGDSFGEKNIVKGPFFRIWKLDNRTNKTDSSSHEVLAVRGKKFCDKQLSNQI